MADDLVELGLEGADKLIDKHFHKIPDKALHSETYKHPFHHSHGSSQDQQRHRDEDSRRESQRGRERDKRRDFVWEEQESLAEEGRYTPQSRRREGEQETEKRNFDTTWDYNNNRRDSGRDISPRTRMSSSHLPLQQQDRYREGRPRDNGNSTLYAQDGPFVTAPWTNLPDYHAPALGGNQSQQQFSTRDSRHYDPANYRPPAQRRRSSSYHGPRGRDRFYSDTSSSSSDSDSDRRPRRSGDTKSHQGGTKNTQLTRRDGESQYNKTAAAHARSDYTSSKNPHTNRDFKDNIKDNFTDSPQGLAGSALGAIVGGYVTHKALEARSHGENKDRDKALTLLGAVVSGVAINAVVDKFEDRRGERDERRRQGREVREQREREGRRRDGRDRFSDGDGLGEGRRARSERGGEREYR